MAAQYPFHGRADGRAQRELGPFGLDGFGYRPLDPEEEP